MTGSSSPTKSASASEGTASMATVNTASSARRSSLSVIVIDLQVSRFDRLIAGRVADPGDL